MAEPENVRFDLKDGIAVITLDRTGARNALDVPMAKALYEAGARAAGDPGARAVVVTGAGGHFCAGGDVKLFAEAADRSGAAAAQVIKDMTLYLHGAISALARARKPWINAIEGTAAGGGFSLGIAADLVLASDNARFTYAYTNIGLSPDGSSSWSLPRMIGVRKALWLAYRNPTLSAEEARALGLVAEVYPAAEFESRWRAAARSLADGPTAALGAAKRLLRTSLLHDLEGQMEEEREEIDACARSEDFHEGVKAFAGKRKATFRGS